MLPAFLFTIFVAHSSVADGDGKPWVWSSNRRSGSERLYTGVASNSGHTAAVAVPSKSLFNPASEFEAVVPQSTKLRYEVSEQISEFPKPPRPPIYPEEQYRPTQTTINGYRPDTVRPTDNYYKPINRPDNSYRPSSTGNYRPPENNYRPPDNFRPGQGNGYRPPGNGGYRPTGPNKRPILTGPVPSWEQGDVRYKEYDRCKCVHSFNCNSPGIQFGTCDIDKQYCCYKDVNRPFGPRPGENDRNRPILAGPGGPIDRPSYRPSQFNSGSSQFNTDRFQGPSRPYPQNERYSKDYKDSAFGTSLEEAYKKGLESAIHEAFQYPSRYDNPREYSSEDFNKRPFLNSKYGLYDSYSNFYGGRSTNSTILAEKS